MRIGLYGGSFDPVHLGHVLVAQTAREEAGLDRIHFIPAAQSPFKPARTLSPPAARLRLLRLALAGRADCEIDPQELERGGVSYTIDTVRRYAERYPGVALLYLIGADHTALLPKWRDAAELAARVEFLVIPRPGTVPEPLPTGFKGRYLAGFPWGLSSSQVRGRVRDRQPVELLVGGAVAGAIAELGLYAAE